MITLRNVYLRRGANLLLEDVNWTIFPKQHIGIIGENGSGKSSLFALLLGQLEADKGALDIPNKLKIAAVAQETAASGLSAIDYVLQGDTELQQLQSALTLAEKNDDGTRIATLHMRLHEIDAYTANARAAQLLDGLGFSQQEQQQAVSDFSGGWRARLNLGKALMSRSDILLLDEPTNHLDLDAVIWLEQWLQSYPGTLLLISHDRDFLDHTVDHIAHIAHHRLKNYVGDYSAFEKQRALALQIQQVQYEKQQKYIAHMQKFIDRFKAKASKAKQAQSRVKAIERLEIISAVQSESPFQFQFKEPERSPNPLISLQDAAIAYGEKKVLNHLQLHIAPDDRIALIGPNGAGKSSLIKLLAGELQPTSGVRQAGSGLKIGYFAQHQIDHLILHDSPIEHIKRIAPDTREQILRTFLGSFGFTAQRIFEPIHHFSGGEKSRLALALIAWQKPNLLLLDEPTNHLDLEMRNALSLALQEYQGAMVIVSHDRFLIRATVNQLMLVAHQTLNLFQGDLKDYEQWLIQYRKTEPLKNAKEEAPQKNPQRPLRQKLQKLEKTLEQLKNALTEVETQLTEPNVYENPAALQDVLEKQAKIQDAMQKTELEWLEVSEQLSQ